MESHQLECFNSDSHLRIVVLDGIYLSLHFAILSFEESMCLFMADSSFLDLSVHTLRSVRKIKLASMTNVITPHVLLRRSMSQNIKAACALRWGISNLKSARLSHNP